jgi:subtilisin family serine protease
MNSFSNYGKCVDILAPGHYIAGAWIGNENSSKTISGTSMASPHVAGVVALYLAEDSDFTPASLKVQIQDLSTRDMVKKIPANTKNFLVFNNFKGESDEPAVFQSVPELFF